MRTYANNTVAAACMPGVLQNKSTIKPTAKPDNKASQGAVRTGNNKIISGYTKGINNGMPWKVSDVRITTSFNSKTCTAKMSTKFNRKDNGLDILIPIGWQPCLQGLYAQYSRFHLQCIHDADY